MGDAKHDPPRHGEYPHLFLLGLTGGVAAGKTTVARALEARGAIRIDADELAAAVLEEPAMLERVRARFGDAVLDGEGQLDRAALADEIFADDAARQDLEGLVHPRVRAAIRARLEELERTAARSQRPQVVVLDIPLLVESGWHHSCDRVLFIAASERERRRRAVAIRGWAERDWRRRESKQTPLELKRDLAQKILRNEDELELLQAVERFYRELVSELSRDDPGF